MSARTRLLGLLLLALAGCVTPQARMQMAEDAEAKKDLSVKTVGDVVNVVNVGPVQVSGIGLVTGLDGTGHTPPGGYRSLLEQEMFKRRMEHVKDILDSPNNALVLVTAFIPSGARKGDRIDVEVTLPPGSKASSLAGGTLRLCALRDHTSTKHVNPEFEGADRLLAGHILARAEGPVLLGFSGQGSAAAADLKRGRVWQGCISHIDVPFYLELKKEDKSARMAHSVAERVNYLCQEDPQKLQRIRQASQVDEPGTSRKPDLASLQTGAVAKAEGKDRVYMRVPYLYRFNPARYLRTATLMPLYADGEQQSRYRRRLQKMLADPNETLRAAARLEALGKDSVPVLVSGLGSVHPLVRFASAEALTYLGSAAGIEELARLARTQPLLTDFCLRALGGLDEGETCRARLKEMLAEDDATLRCGAFHYLRQLAERDIVEKRPAESRTINHWLEDVDKLNGIGLNDSFWVHRVAPRSARLVTFTVSLRAEVVLYGDRPSVIRPVRTQAGKDFVFTFTAGDDRCFISRISAQEGRKVAPCQPRLDDVVRVMAELGAEYPDLVDLLRKLDEQQCLNCPVRIAALPEEVSLESLIDSVRNGRIVPDQTPVSEIRGTK